MVVTAGTLAILRCCGVECQGVAGVSCLESAGILPVLIGNRLYLAADEWVTIVNACGSVAHK